MKYVYYGGSFDLFHLGHLKAIKRIRKIADKHGAKLIVAVNTDSLYRNYKEKEPVIPYKYRKEMIESLKEVDKVIPKKTFSDVSLLNKYKPVVFVICEEWRESKSEEISLMKKYGKTIVVPYFKGISATEIRDKIINNYRQKERLLCDECHRKI